MQTKHSNYWLNSLNFCIICKASERVLIAICVCSLLICISAKPVSAKHTTLAQMPKANLSLIPDLKGFKTIKLKVDSLLAVDISKLTIPQKATHYASLAYLQNAFLGQNNYRSIALARKYANESKDPLLQVLAQRQYQRILLQSESVDSVKLAAKLMLQIYQRTGNLNAKGLYLKMQSLALYHQANYADALKTIQKAVEVFQECKCLDDEAGAMLQMAFIYGFQGKIAKTIEINKKAEALYKQISPNASGLIGFYNNIAIIFVNDNKLDSAKYYIIKGLQLADNLGNIREWQNTLIIYAEVLDKQNQNEQALAVLEMAYKCMLYTKDYDLMLVLKQSLANHYASQNQQKRAVSILKEVIQANIKSQRIYAAMETSFILSKLLYKTKDYKQAYYYQIKFKAFEDSVRSINKLNEQENLFFSFEKDQQVVTLARQKTTIDLINANSTIALLIAILGALIFVAAVALFFRVRKQNAELALRQRLITKSQQLLSTGMATKNMIFGIISHDIRGPIGSLSHLPDMFEEIFDSTSSTTNNKQNQNQTLPGSALLQSDDKIDKKKIDLLTTSMSKSLVRVAALLEDLLSWAQAKPSDNNFITVQLQSNILDFQSLFASMLTAKNQTLQIQIPPDLTLKTNLNALNTCLRNLISNAIKFSPLNGKIIVDGTVAKNEYNQNITLITIQDFGIGMPQNTLDNLFMPTVNIQRQGTASEPSYGLGLLLVADILKQLDAAITVESKENIGTKITLSFIQK